jgi:pimeloyl-ACP methyl ester carboxylesterase
MGILFLIVAALAGQGGARHAGECVVVRVPVDRDGQIDFSVLLGRLASEAGTTLARVPPSLRLPIRGAAGALTRTHLAEALGPGATIRIEASELRVEIPPDWLAAAGRARFVARVRDLGAEAAGAAERLGRYGMRALGSYRPDDTKRPTICLLHGINSSSGSFMHMVGPLEAAGFGLVAYNFPFNRDLETTVEAFARDWGEFRKRRGDTRPWAIITHSMGGLIARAYVEGVGYRDDVNDLLLIAPPNGGSAVAGAQTLLQLVQGLQSVNRRESGALLQLSEGLGEAADDLRPGSTFLRALNARPRRASVRYHILAGDSGFLSPAVRQQVEAQAQAVTRGNGLLGGLAKMAMGNLAAQLDELTDGRGDGCVALASTRLEGVTDREVLHANHVELIRGPMLYPEPGPVACMPWVLSRLKVQRPGS